VRPRTTPDWRPFNSSLSARSVGHATSILGALFRWLIEKRTCRPIRLRGTRCGCDRIECPRRVVRLQRRRMAARTVDRGRPGMVVRIVATLVGARRAAAALSAGLRLRDRFARERTCRREARPHRNRSTRRILAARHRQGKETRARHCRRPRGMRSHAIWPNAGYRLRRRTGGRPSLSSTA
jgi:hypothetical protein